MKNAKIALTGYDKKTTKIREERTECSFVAQGALRLNSTAISRSLSYVLYGYITVI
jgi:hypothetical protein